MSKAVRVTAVGGQVIVPSKNNPEFGYVRVEQLSVEYKGKWQQLKTRSALIQDTVKNLKLVGYTAGQELPGKIVIIESLEGSENEIKRAGKDGPACTVNGQTIYRSSIYTEEIGATDDLILHDNQDEIEAHNEKIKAEEANL